MSDSDWDDVLHQLDDMMGDGGGGGGSKTWHAYEEAYQEDLAILHLAAWNLTNDDEIRSWINTTHDQAATAAFAFGNLWRTKVRPDVAMMTKLNTIADAWTDEVDTPVRNEPQSVRDSGLLRSWYGPGAQKYATAVLTQASAMDEMNVLSSGAGAAMKNTANLVKNIGLLMLHSLQPVHDKLAGWPKHGWGDELQSDMIFGERTAYGKAQFEGLRDWLQDLVDGGDWKDQALQIKTSFEDLKVKTVAFKSNAWPTAVTDGIGDMKNGDGGLGDQTQQPGAQQPIPSPTQPSNEPDPDAPGTTTVDDKGKVTTTGGGTPGGDDQYEGTGYGGRNYDNQDDNSGADAGYTNVKGD